MPVTVRPIDPEEMDEFVRVVALCLNMSPEPIRASMQPEFTLCAFEDDKLATAYAAWPFTMRINGAPVPIAGVTTVGTLPVFRLRGNLRRIMQTDFQRLYEREGPPLAVLYASQAAIYQRYGYGIVSTHISYRVEPRYLTFAHGVPIRGSLRESGRDEAALLNDVFRRYRDPRNGVIHRSRPLWAANQFADPPEHHELSVVVYEEDGQALGYVIYTTGPGSYPPPGVGGVLNVREVVWLTPAAYIALWRHIAGFELMREVIWRSAPSDDPLPHLLLEPRMLQATARDGILARIVDLPRTLASRTYATEAVLTFEVQDELCPWNAGRWRMETGADGAARVARTTENPQVTMPVSTLAMLLFGQISAGEAARMGRLDAHDEPALDAWDAVFRTRYRPFCPDQF